MLVLFLGFGAGPLPVTAEEAAPLVGFTLTEALLKLKARGLRLFFTSGVVTEAMRVESHPAGEHLREVLDELLEPHGLVAREGPGDTLVVLRAPRPAVDTPPPRMEVSTEDVARPHYRTRDEIFVTPSRLSLLRDRRVARAALGRDEILTLPHLGEDFFRAITLLPGTASGDLSAQFHVRGGRLDEVQILFDGQELYDAYHLQDFDNALSLVSTRSLSSVDLTTGGYPAAFGDRMSGVLEMSSVTPSGSPRAFAAVSLFSLQAGGGGGFGDGRGSWLAQGRHGSIGLTGELLGTDRPEYWDAFGKLDWEIGSRGSLRAHLLSAGDRLEIDESIDEEIKLFRTDYDSRYVWLTHQALLSADLFVDSTLSSVSVDRDRRGRELEDVQAFDIRDERTLEVASLRQAWNFAAPRHQVTGGFELRDFTAAYDYFGSRRYDNPLAAIRTDPDDGVRVFERSFRESHGSLHLADRWDLVPEVAMDLGLRFDRYTATDENLVSPRLGVAWSPTPEVVLRAAWGRYVQSQRPYELQVGDGETTFAPVERSHGWILGLERRLFGARRPETTLRIEAYRRKIDNPRPRFENLFEPINTFPEIEPDRVRIEPEKTVAEGVELFLRSAGGPRFRGWLSYTWAQVEDSLEDRRAPRRFDQRHSLSADLNIRLAWSWNLNLAWRFHTGWPTTPLDLLVEEDGEGELAISPRLGEINSLRLPDYHRLDLRASRRWELGTGSLGVFVDVQNVYDRSNLAGFDPEVDEDEGTLVMSPEYWVGILPSVGISWEN